MKLLRYLIPLTLLMLVGIVLWYGLDRDPRHIPSPLVNKPLPAFDLPRLKHGTERLTAESLTGQIALLNVWATWCNGCYTEHELLLSISNDHAIPIYGINYKDDRQLALSWLRNFGDPYHQIGFDGDGAVGLDLGVYGLPETYLLDSASVVVHKHTGPLTMEAWQQELLPLILSMRRNQ